MTAQVQKRGSPALSPYSLYLKKCHKYICLYFKQNRQVPNKIYKLTRMGSSLTRQPSTPKKVHMLSLQSRLKNTDFNTSEWQPLKQYDNITELRNKITNEQIDKYYIQFQSKSEQKNYYECYLQRLYEEYIVNTVHYESIQNSNEFCSEFHSAYVYIEHIHIRLSNITDIPFPQNIYIMRTALLGFQILYDIIGYFDVMEEHVCIDKYGAVKIWMNEALQKNYPEEFDNQWPIINAGGTHSKDQYLMVQTIIAMVEQNSEEQSYFPKVSDYMNSHQIKSLGFEEALNVIDAYLREYQIKLPDYCESILEIFEDIQTNIELTEQQMHDRLHTNASQRYQHSRLRLRNSTSQKSQIINNIHIPRLPIGEEKTVRKSTTPKRTTKKSSIKQQQAQKSRNILPKYLVTDRTVPLYQDFTRPHNMSFTDRSNNSYGFLRGMEQNRVPNQIMQQQSIYAPPIKLEPQNRPVPHTFNSNLVTSPVMNRLPSPGINYKMVHEQSFRNVSHQPKISPNSKPMTNPLPKKPIIFSYSKLEPRSSYRDPQPRNQNRYPQPRSQNKNKLKQTTLTKQTNILKPVSTKFQTKQQSLDAKVNKKSVEKDIMDEMDPDILADLAQFL